MKTRSLQSKLTIFYGLTIFVPILIFSFILPYYYQHLIERETQALTENTLTVATRNIETYLDDLERLTIVPYFNNSLMKALNLKASSEYPQNDLSTKRFVEKTLSSSLQTYFQNLQKDNAGTILLTNDNSVYVENAGLTSSVPDYPYKDQEWFRKTIALNGKAAFISAHKQDYLTSPAAEEVFSVARLIKDPESLAPLAVIMADADTSVLNQLFNYLNFDVKSYGAILNENNELFYSSSQLPFSMLLQLQEGKTTIKSEDDSYVLVSKMIRPANWKVVVLLSKSELNKKVKWMYLTGILFAFAGLLLTFLLFFVLSRRIVNPFKQLIKGMNKVEQGDFSVRVHASGNDEITQLGNSFNSMVDKINDLIDREYKAVLSQRNAEFRALQSQIQPHFLFNTLNGFIALNRMGDRNTLEDAIYSLSKMLRYSLKQEDWTTLKADFEFIKSYCSIQQLRFDDRLKVNFHLDEQIENYLIPTLLIQPFVENAIIHGVEPCTHPCTLNISAKVIKQEQEQYLEIRIQDDGVGFNADQIFESNSIGITNVRERLKIIYPSSSFQITSSIHNGTIVIIQIPEMGVKNESNASR
ncbi:sensor histidine kinase [Neobacillus sp. NPDC058068]|uniref:cache domain-containing sensor histidine kinase n=1 Tax=Neobacillus sp. NPDC058068 TaxID=3346325 RepID=UPI0036D7644D